MIYYLLKPFIRFAVTIFCPGLEFQDKSLKNLKGPVLITANHPNSFLDAIIIASIIDRPIHFLARGDAFHKGWHNFLLRTLHMFPIYRLREGKEYLGLNETAFENSRKVLRKNGIVLIFIEGICLNKHELQPFKKGAARIASTCWKEEIPLKVLPLGIGYDSLKQIGKTVIVQNGDLMNQNELMYLEEDAKNFVLFNQILFQKIQGLIKLPETSIQIKKNTNLFAFIGIIIHQPLFQIIKGIVKEKTKDTVFYDSVLFGVLFILYPFYLILLGFFLLSLEIPIIIVLTILIAHPILAYFACKSKMHTRSSISL